MAFVIVSRWDKTRTLYRAEGAQDLRGAVVEAVKARADLAGADLAGALVGEVAPGKEQTP